MAPPFTLHSALVAAVILHGRNFARVASRVAKSVVATAEGLPAPILQSTPGRAEVVEWYYSFFKSSIGYATFKASSDWRGAAGEPTCNSALVGWR